MLARKACCPEPALVGEGSAPQANADSSPRKQSPRPGITICLFLIRVYQQFFSPLMPLGCRFYPTCSHYAAEAIARHGALRGLWMGVRRILRCHPFSFGGFDPVPNELAGRGTALTCAPAATPSEGGDARPLQEPAR